MPRILYLPKNNSAIVPDNRTDEQAMEWLKSNRPEIFLPDAPPPAPAPTSRTFGEAAVDIGAGFTKGIGSLVQLPSQVSGLVSGDMEAGTVGKFGKSIEEYGESLKSPYLRAQEAQQQKLTQEAYEKSGILGEAGQAIKGTITNPALLTSFLSEQIPNFIGSLGAGAVAKIGVQTVARLSTGIIKDVASTSAKAGVSAALATNAVMQGTDVGAETYQSVYDRLKIVSPEMLDDERKDIALSKGRAAGSAAAAISLGLTQLPGAKTIEKAFLGKTAGDIEKQAGKGILRRTAEGFGGEALSEGLEEGPGGQLLTNVALQQVDPSQRLGQGVGAATGLGAIAGGIFGGLSGAVSTNKPPPPPLDTQFQILADDYQKKGLNATTAYTTAARDIEKYAQPGETLTVYDSLGNEIYEVPIVGKNDAGRAIVNVNGEEFVLGNEYTVSDPKDGRYGVKKGDEFVASSELNKDEVTSASEDIRTIIEKLNTEFEQTKVKIPEHYAAERRGTALDAANAALEVAEKTAQEEAAKQKAPAVKPVRPAPAAAQTVTPAPAQAAPAAAQTSAAPDAASAPAAPAADAAAPAADAPAADAAAPAEQATAQTMSAEQQAAIDFIAAVDLGGIPLNPSKANAVARGLGLEVNTKSKPDETIQRIRDAVGRITPTEQTADLQAAIDAASAAGQRATTEQEDSVEFDEDAIDAEAAAQEAEQAKADADAITAANASKKLSVAARDLAKSTAVEDISNDGYTRLLEAYKKYNVGDQLYSSLDNKRAINAIEKIERGIEGRLKNAGVSDQSVQGKSDLSGVINEIHERVRGDISAKQSRAPRTKKGTPAVQNTLRQLLTEMRKARNKEYYDKALPRVATLVKKRLGQLGLGKHITEDFIKLLQAGREESGQYLERVISLAIAGRSDKQIMSVLDHEAIHAMRKIGMITENEWKNLTNLAEKRDWINTFLINDRYKGRLNPTTAELKNSGLSLEEWIQEAKYEEAIADAFSTYANGRSTILGYDENDQPVYRYKKDLKLAGQPVGIISRILKILGIVKDVVSEDVEFKRFSEAPREADADKLKAETASPKLSVTKADLGREKTGQLYEVYNRKTGKVVGGPYQSRSTARSGADRNDDKYGGYAHDVREVEQKASPKFSVAAKLTAKEKTEPVWYSALSRQIDKLPQKEMTAAEWKALLVKPEETKSRGVRGPDNVVIPGKFITSKIEASSKLPGVKMKEIEDTEILEWLDAAGTSFEVDDYIEVLNKKYGVRKKGNTTYPGWEESDLTDDELNKLKSAQSGGRRNTKISKDEVQQFLADGGAKLEFQDRVLGEPVDKKELFDAEVEKRFKEEVEERANDRYSDYWQETIQKQATEEGKTFEDYFDLSKKEQFALFDRAMSEKNRKVEIEQDIGRDLRSSIYENMRDSNWEPETLVDEPTKFSGYQLPGGKNYREAFVTVPNATGKGKNFAVFNDRDDAYYVGDRDTGNPISRFFATQIEAENSLEGFNRAANASNKWVDGHGAYSGIDNPVVRIRFNDRTDVDGNKVLFLEELQPPTGGNTYVVTLKNGSVAEFETRDRANIYAAQVAAEPQLSPVVSIKKVESGEFGKMPKTLQDRWLAIGLKRMIRYAADNGYAKVAWTTGEQQVKRYESALRTKVDSIEWEKTPEGVQIKGYKNVEKRPDVLPEIRRAAANAIERNDYLGFDSVGEALESVYADRVDWEDRWSVESMNDRAMINRYIAARSNITTREKVVDTRYAENDLTEVIGKVMADRIRNDPNQTGVIEGDNLTVDSVGVKKLYDVGVPAQANKILKEMGGGRVGEVDLPMPWSLERESEYFEKNGVRPKGPDNLKQPSFDITPALSERAMQGMPRFSVAPKISRNIVQNNEGYWIYKGELPESFYRWFGKSVVTDKDGYPRVMFHGTARDITEFKQKQANAIFITDDEAFAGDFSAMSFDWMRSHIDQFVTPERQEELAAKAKKIRAADKSKIEYEEFQRLLLDELPSGKNIMPLFVRAEKPFDYSDTTHLNAVRKKLEKNSDFSKQEIDLVLDTVKRGAWAAIERDEVQAAIRAAGFDGFYAKEAGRVNLAVYDANQVKSVTGNSGEYSRESKDIRRSVAPLLDTSSLVAISKVANGRAWDTGRNLKIAIQDIVTKAAEQDGIDLSSRDQKTKDYLVKATVQDGLYALQQNKSAIGWYDLKTRQALAVMSIMYPELRRDQNAKLAFIWALAVSSNGQKVLPNFRMASKIYKEYKLTGRMPENIGIGQAGKAINKGLRRFNQLKAQWGIDKLRKFSLTDFTVGEITSLSQDLKPDGEHAATVVRGSAILGPKVGNGFFSNLYGMFDSLTMDRWLIRSWGRWSGTLLVPKEQQTQTARTRLNNIYETLLQNSSEAKRLSGLIKSPIEEGISIDDLAKKINKASQSPETRAELNATEFGSELRLAGNGLTKYLDAQKEAPANADERNFIREVFNTALKEIRLNPNYSSLQMADLQAVLWYAEKRLYETAKKDEVITDENDIKDYNDDEAPDYANAAAIVAEENNVPKAKIQRTLREEENARRTATTRPSSEGQNYVRPQQFGQAIGFVGREKTSFIRTVAVLDARSNRRDTEESSYAYQRKSGAVDQKPRLLKKLDVRYVAEWNPGKKLGVIYRRNRINTPTFFELDKTEDNAAKFAGRLNLFKYGNKDTGAAVYVYPNSDYANMRMFLAEDGRSGFAIKDDGDIVSVFSGNGSGHSIVSAAVEAGGIKLDAFDTVLPEIYGSHGFEVVSRIKWNEEEIPTGWDKKSMREFNNGEPDVVFMVYNPNYFGEYGKKDGKTFTGDTAYRRASLLQNRESNRQQEETNSPLITNDEALALQAEGAENASGKYSHAMQYPGMPKANWPLVPETAFYRNNPDRDDIAIYKGKFIQLPWGDDKKSFGMDHILHNAIRQSNRRWEQVTDKDDENAILGIIDILNAKDLKVFKESPLDNKIIIRSGKFKRAIILGENKDDLRIISVVPSEIPKFGKIIDQTPDVKMSDEVLFQYKNNFTGIKVKFRFETPPATVTVKKTRSYELPKQSVAPKFSTTRTVGATKRPYTPEQLKYFSETGRTIEIPTLKERIQALFENFSSNLAQGIADQFDPLKKLDPMAYLLARMSRGTSGALESLLKYGKLKIRGGLLYDADRSGGFLEKVVMPMNGEFEDFLWWVAANRAGTLFGVGKENLFSPANIIAGKALQNGTLTFSYKLSNGTTTTNRAEMFKDSLVKYNAFNSNVLDMAEQSGLVDKSTRDVWEQAMYVPFFRVSEDQKGFIGEGIKQGLVRQAAFKTLKGGTNKLNSDLMSNVLQNWYHLIDASAKNRASNRALDVAVATGAAVTASESTIRSMGKSLDMRSGVVWDMRKGHKQYYLVEDQAVVEALTALEPANIPGPMMKGLHAFKYYLTLGVTISPYYKVRNLIRDSVQSVAVSDLSYNVFKNLGEGYAATDRKSQDYVTMLASGATMRFGTSMEGDESGRVRALVKSGVKDSTILDSPGKVKAFFDQLRPFTEMYSDIGSRGEEINRAALYKRVLAKLTSQGMSSDDAHAQAAFLARDLMDFSMQGSWGTIRFLTQVVPFMNSRIQGLYKLGRAAKQDKARMAIVIGAASVFGLTLMAMFKDDDDWKKRTDADRNNYWWFKFGGIAYRIPKPFEVGAISTVAERGWELFFDNEMTGKRFSKNMEMLLLDNLAMNPIPQVFKPLLDVYSNKDGHSGIPIETMGMEKLLPEFRFTSETTAPAKALSTLAMGTLSPVQIDYMIKGYFGWLGTFVVGGADMAVNLVTSGPAKPSIDIISKISNGMVRTLPEKQSRYVNQIYEQAKELEQVYGTQQYLLQKRKLEEYREFTEENKEKLRQYRLIEPIKKMESALNKRIRQIEDSTTKDSDTKRDEINALQQRRDQLARRLSARFQ